MSDRVLVTDQARQATTRMQSIINGGLVEQITALDQQGKVLSDASVWDGRLAGEFRSQWPEVHQRLERMREALEELRESAKRIHDDIFRAGGNA